jgi:hypothetical protein
MHCVFLCTYIKLNLIDGAWQRHGAGMVKHLTRVILFKSGMLNASRNGTHNPIARLEQFYSRIIWPVSIGRLPPAVCSKIACAIFISHALAPRLLMVLVPLKRTSGACSSIYYLLGSLLHGRLMVRSPTRMLLCLHQLPRMPWLKHGWTNYFENGT